MAEDDNVIVGIEFLVGACGNVPHGNVLGSFEARGLVFPRLANIEQRKYFPALLQRFDLTGRDFEVHSLCKILT